MRLLRKKFEGSPEYARVAPFAIFVLLTALQGQFGEESRYWIYLLKTVVGLLIWLFPFRLQLFEETFHLELHQNCICQGQTGVHR